MQLAEGVESLEKYAYLEHLGTAFGGEGRRSKWRPAVQGILGNERRRTRLTPEAAKQSFSKCVPKPELGYEEEAGALGRGGKAHHKDTKTAKKKPRNRR